MNLDHKWQPLIDRYALSSLSMKCVAAVVAVILIQGSWFRPNMHFHVAIILLLILWFADAYFKLRKDLCVTLFTNGRILNRAVDDGSMRLTRRDYLKAIFSKPLVAYHVPIFLITSIEFLMH